MDRFRWAANLATLGNAALGLGAVAYVLDGNSMFAMLLIVMGVGLDGLDGLFSRRSSSPASLFGRVADSSADAVTFGAAPAVLLMFHSYNSNLWAPWSAAAYAVGGLVLVLAVARLTYFTARGYQRPYFVGAPTPQTALAIVVLILFFDQPAFWGTDPVFLLVAAATAAVAMVIPIRFPKVRRGSAIRPVSAFTGVALTLALVPLQFQPVPGSAVYTFALVGAAAGAAGVLAYYVWGPFTIEEAPVKPEAVGA